MLTAAQVKFDPVTHTYTAPNGRRLANVTSVLDAEHLLPIYPDNGCKERGSAVHYCWLMLGQGRLEIGREYQPGWFEFPGAPEVLWPWLDGFLAYRRAVPFRPIYQEQRVIHPGLWYAGTLDCAGELDGVLAIDDYKSGAPAGAVGLQLAAYTLALAQEHPEYRHAKRRAIHLHDHTYNIVPCDDEQDFDDWITVVKHYHFLKRFKK